jgi:hypothetical protein
VGEELPRGREGEIATARSVVVAGTSMGSGQVGDAPLAGVPSCVQWTTAPAVVDEMLTVCADA